MPQCLIPNYTNLAGHILGICCRRPETTAIWALNCDAYLCNYHADQGYTIDMTLTPIPASTIKTKVTLGADIASRTTPISHDSVQ